MPKYAIIAYSPEIYSDQEITVIAEAYFENAKVVSIDDETAPLIGRLRVIEAKNVSDMEKLTFSKEANDTRIED